MARMITLDSKRRKRVPQKRHFTTQWAALAAATAGNCCFILWRWRFLYNEVGFDMMMLTFTEFEFGVFL